MQAWRRSRQRIRCERARRSCACAPSGHSLRGIIAVALLLQQLTGCYRYVPVTQSVAPVGSQVNVGITDRGRVALSDAVGPGVRRVEGRVLESSDSVLVLSVMSVQHIDLGVPAKWMGERVEIGRDFVAEMRARQFSRSRTTVAIGLAAAGAVAVSFIALNGFGGVGGTGKDPGNGNQQSRF